MPTLVITLLLASAIIHAGWNALVRSGKDRLWSIAVISLFGGIAAIPFAVMLESPGAESWPFLLGSSLLQVFYCLLLARAYEHGELVKVYPIARGSAPLLVTLGAAIFARELPGLIGLSGILLVSSGIMILMLGRSRADSRSLLAALAAGAFIASYMVTDGLGVRAAGSALGYAAWQAVLGGFLIYSSYFVVRRCRPAMPRGKESAVLAVAGILATLAYCVAIWAMSQSPMGGVSAIRETSILFAALIGAVALKERLTAQKLIGAVTIAGGVACLALW